jgi:hypothetical protein
MHPNHPLVKCSAAGDMTTETENGEIALERIVELALRF